jgi:conjugal transfer ATP-binding protein TraC
MRILKTLKSNRPKYSDIFMDTGGGVGVARLMVDPWSYYVYTSDPDEIVEIERLVEGGMSYEDAISEMAKRRGND